MSPTAHTEDSFSHSRFEYETPYCFNILKWVEEKWNLFVPFVYSFIAAKYFGFPVGCLQN